MTHPVAGHATPTISDHRLPSRLDGAADIGTVDDSAVEHSAVEHSAVEHSAVEHSAVEHNAVEHSAVQHSAVQHSAVQHSAVQQCAEEPGGLLRRHGLRLTAQRLAVLRALARLPHSTADELHAAVRADLGTVSRQTVYDVLAALADRGIVRRVQPAGSPARFENRAGDNHHHLICRRCGRMTDVDCAVGDTPCLSVGDDAGYEVDEAEVIYWGRCPRCREATASATSSSATSTSATSSSATTTGEAPT